ncbi:hypothetical protein Hanom_Chr10g00883281 [Helianthus anomalus]
MAKFKISSQTLFFLWIAIFLIMASMAPQSLSRTLISSASMDLDHHKSTHDPNMTSFVHSRNRGEFEADAHEVPTGPNPISNNLVG